MLVQFNQQSSEINVSYRTKTSSYVADFQATVKNSDINLNLFPKLNENKQ